MAAPQQEALLPAAVRTDAVVIGAGPVGLFQVFQLGLQEIHVELLDALPHAGGQCVELYPDKPIYDIPGLPVCSGHELADRLQRQMAPMRPGLHLGQVVQQVAARADGRFDVATAQGLTFDAGCIVIAGGVGAFEPKRLKLDGIETFEGRQVHHQLPAPALLVGRAVLIVGGEEDAIDTALQLGDVADAAPASITLLYRRDVLKASPARLAEFSARCHAGRLRFVIGQPVGFEADAEKLRSLQVVHADGQTRALPFDQLLVRQGLSPRLGPIAEWGLAMQRKQLQVDTERFETSVPGIYAVGDVNTYPGKQKLIVCGFHEATLAAFAAAARLFPDRPQHLQYTTTSTKLHRLLGLHPPVAAG